jgi:hypothetical protein
MSRRHFKRVGSMLAGVALAVSLLAGCGDKGSPKAEPPVEPPLSTMAMDFSEFGAATAMAARTLPGAALTKANWTWSAGNIVVWNTVITVELAIPVAAFAESFHHEPVEQTDGTWVWSYNVQAGGTLYLAELTADFIAADQLVEWNMYVSKQGAYEDFRWFSGNCNWAATAGTWVLYTSPSNNDPLLAIAWNRNPQAGTADIKYMDFISGNGNPYQGSYITYGITAATPFNAFYDIYNKGQDNHTSIEWNRADEHGRVSDALHFGDGAWHCWDLNLDDVACP